MDWVECKSVWVVDPEFADGFVGCETAKGLESPGEVVGCDEVRQVRFELFVGVIEEAFDGGFLDGPVHAFDLSVGPGMVGSGQTVADAMTKTNAIEGMSTPSRRKPSTVFRQVGELDSVVGEHGVDTIRNGFDECFEEGSGRLHIGLFHEFHHGKLRGPVDGHEEVEFAFGRSHFGQIDMEEADRIGVELLSPGLVSLDLRQPADAMPFQATLQRRASQLRNRSLSFHALEKYAPSNAGTKHLVSTIDSAIPREYPFSPTYELLLVEHAIHNMAELRRCDTHTGAIPTVRMRHG